MKNKNLVSIAVALSIVAQTFSTYADTVTSGDNNIVYETTEFTADYTDESQMTTTNSVDVTVDYIDSIYTVKIPKTIVLDSATGKGEYTVEVNGVLKDDESIYVTPDGSFKLTRKSDGAEAYGLITQPITRFWNSNADETKITDSETIVGRGPVIGKIEVAPFETGSWSGTFNFTIKYYSNSYTLVWVGNLTGDGGLTRGYMGTGDMPDTATSTALWGTCRILYTNMYGTVDYADVTKKGYINIKRGTPIYFQMYSNPTGETMESTTVRLSTNLNADVGVNVTGKTESSYDGGKLIQRCYTPTGNALVTKYYNVTYNTSGVGANKKYYWYGAYGITLKYI